MADTRSDYPPWVCESTTSLCRARIAQYLNFCVLLRRSIIVFLSLFLYYPSFFDLRPLVTPLVSSNFTDMMFGFDLGTVLLVWYYFFHFINSISQDASVLIVMVFIHKILFFKLLVSQLFISVLILVIHLSRVEISHWRSNYYEMALNSLIIPHFSVCPRWEILISDVFSCLEVDKK